MYSVISFGAVVAFVLVRLADRWGRRPILTVTIIGYTMFTFVTGFAPDPVTFTIAPVFGASLSDRRMGGGNGLCRRGVSR